MTQAVHLCSHWSVVATLSVRNICIKYVWSWTAVVAHLGVASFVYTSPFRNCKKFWTSVLSMNLTYTIESTQNTEKTSSEQSSAKGPRHSQTPNWWGNVRCLSPKPNPLLGSLGLSLRPLLVKNYKYATEVQTFFVVCCLPNALTIYEKLSSSSDSVQRK